MPLLSLRAFVTYERAKPVCIYIYIWRYSREVVTLSH